MPEGGNAQGLRIVSGLTAEIAVPEWASHSGVFAHVGDDLVIAGPDGATFSIPGYFAAIPRPLLTSEDGRPLPASLLQAALAQSHDQQVAQAFGVPPAAGEAIDPADDPAQGNFDIVGIGGQQNPGGVQIPSESLERLMTSVAAGGNVEQALQSVFQQAAQDAIALGASPQQALQQYETFANILSGAIAEGVNPAQALSEANAVFLNQGVGAPSGGAAIQQTVSPEQAMLNAIASGDNAGQLAGSQAFQQALADALQSGAQVNQALNSANVANANVEQALAQTATGTADPMLAALASGENLGVIPAGADFQQALADALANGASPTQAMLAATATTDAVTNAQNAVNTGGGDPTLQAIASGDASAISGSPEMIAALSDALQGGANVNAAMSVATQADAAIANAVTQSATGAADPILAAIASGDAGAISGSPEMIAALSQALQGGANVEAAMTVATQTGAAISDAVAQTATGTADPIMQMLASGDTTNLADNPILIAALNEALANNATPGEAMQQAQQTQEAVANAQATTNVGGGDNGGLNQVVAAVTESGPATPGGSSDVLGTNPGEQGGPETLAALLESVAPGADAPPADGQGQAQGQGQGEGQQQAQGQGEGQGKGEEQTKPPTPVAIPDFGKINAAIADSLASIITPIVTPIVQVSTDPVPTPSAPPVQVTPDIVPARIPAPTTLTSTPSSQVVREGLTTYTLDLSKHFSGEELKYSVSNLPDWAELVGSIIQTKAGRSAEADGVAEPTIDVTVNGANGVEKASFILRVNDSGQIATANTLAISTSAPIQGVVAVDAQITFNDIDTGVGEAGTFDKAVLRAEISYDGTNTTTGDNQLWIINAGTGSGQIGITATAGTADAEITYGGVLIATVTQNGDGTTPLVITLNASATDAAIQALMRAVSYQNESTNPDLSTAPTVSLTLTEFDGTVTDAYEREIVVGNALPIFSSNISFSGNEDSTVTLDITTFNTPFSDTDGDLLAKIRIDTLPDSSFGTLKLDGVAISAGAVISRADIVAGKLTFVPNDNFNKEFNSGNPATFTFTASDGKQYAAASNTASVRIDPEEDAPNVTIVAASVLLRPEPGVMHAPVLIAPMGDPAHPPLQIADPDAVSATEQNRFTDGYLEIAISSGQSSSDRLGIKNVSGITVDSSGNVSFGGILIGTVDSILNGGANQPLRINLEIGATEESLQALASAITYDNLDASPGAAPRTIDFTLDDGTGTTPNAPASATVAVTPEDFTDAFDGSSTVRVFDGNDSISLGNASDFINGNATTWEAWIKTEQTTGTQTIIGAGSPATVINTNFNSSTGLTLSGDGQIYNGRLRLTVDNDLPSTGDGDGGETTSTEGSMNVGTTVSGSIDNSSDVDWIRIVLLEGREYSIELREAASSGLSDPDLQGIYDANGNPLSGYSGDLGGAGNDDLRSFVAPYSGEYYIAVYASGGQTGDYLVEVQRTDGVNDQGGSVTIAPPTGTAGATNFSATFDLYIDSDDASLADGFSFNYGVPGFNGPAENGLTTGLSITFDTFDNGGDLGIEVWFNGTRIAGPITSVDFTHAAGKAVAINYDDNGLDVTVGGSAVFTNLAIPAYAAAGKGSYQYIMGARTGADNATHEVDNLKITAGNYNALVVKDGKLAYNEGFSNLVQTNMSNTTVADGNWHHVAMSHDGDQTLKLYVDGQLVQTLTGVTKEILAGSGWIGRNPDSATDFFNGEIAEVRVWGDVRDAVEIAANYLPGLANPGTQPDLDSYWNFDGQTGGTIDDSAIGNHDGTVSGATAAERPEFANWRVVEGSVSANDSIVVANGVATIKNREILQSAEKHTPTSGDPVHVTGKFNYQNEGDLFTIVTRDNSSARDTFGSPDGGIHFDINDVNNQNIIQIWGGPVGARVLRGSAVLDLRAGAHYTFDVFDDGTNIRLTVTEVGNEANSATVITTDTLVSQTDSYVSIHNRDGSAGDFILNLEDVRIDGDIVMSEGVTWTSSLSAPSPLTGALAYSVTDAADHGTFTITNAATGAYTYTPANGYHGRDFITYQVTDAAGRSHVETAVFDVAADTDVNIAGSHLVFDGANDYVRVANAAELQLTTAFTIEAWVRAGDVAHDQLIAGKTNGTAHDFLFKIATNGKLDWFNGTTDVVGSASVDDGEWHHVAVTYENGIVRLYVDGVLDATGAATAPASSAKDFYLGGDGDTSQTLSGALDEVRVWDHARSEDDIRLNHNQNASGSEGGLVGYWTFDNVIDHAAKDLSGDGNTAELGGTRPGDSAEPTIGDGAGKALSFDGTNDWVNMGAGPSNSFRVAGSMTAEGWFNFAEIKTAELISIAGNVGDGDGAQNYLFEMRLLANGKIQLFHESGTGATQVDLTFSPTLALNQWTHLAAVRDVATKTYSLYMNGVLVATQSYTGANPDGGSAASLRLGALVSAGAGSDEFFHGQMDDVRLWNTARSASDILENYRAILDGSPSGLLAQYTFDDGTVASTLGNNTGTANGGASYVDATTPSESQPNINGGTITIAENATLDGVMTPDAALAGAVSYSVQTAGDKGGSISIDPATGHWTYTPLDKFYGTETFTLRAAGATSGTDDEMITVTVEQHSVPSVDVSDGHIQFDGAGDYVAMGRGAADSLAISGDLTIESWVRANASSGDQTIAEFGANGETSATNLLYNLRLTSDGDVVFDHETNAGANANVSDSLRFDTDLSADVWHHIAAVRDSAAKTVSIYIDGELFGTKSYTNNATDGSSANLLVGAQWSGTAPGPNNYFNGALDDLRIWNTARTAAEIETYYDRQLAGTETNLQGNWRFDDATGGVVQDQTANNNDGAISGDASIVPPLDHALSFDGVDDRVSAGRGTADAFAIAGSLTAETWVRFDATTASQQTLFEFSASGETEATNGLYALRLLSGGDIFYDHENGAGVNNGLTFDTNLVAGQWYHIALVRDDVAKTVKLLIDGQLFGMQSYANSPTGGSTATFVLGASNSGTALLDGQMSDVRIWNAARTDAEIAANYNHTLTGTQTGLVANYTMDEIVGGQIIDTAGANNASVDGAVIVDTDPDIFGTSLTINENEIVSGAMTGNDVAGTATYGLGGAGAADADGRVTVATAHGSVTLDITSGEWTYTPQENYHGTDSFTLTASGLHGTNDSEAVTVNIAQVDHNSINVGDGVLTLDGVNDHVALGPLSGLGATGAITMEAWVNFSDFDTGTAGTGWMRIFDFGQGQGDDNVFLAIDGTTGKIHFATWNGTTATGLSTPLPIELNAWTHIAAVNNGNGSGAIYINGELVASVTSGLTAVTNVVRDENYIGRSTWAQDDYTAAMIEDARVWTVARTAEQIRTNYDQQLSGSESGLYANWRMDDDPLGDGIYDSSGHGHNGVRVNGADIDNDVAVPDILGTRLTVYGSEGAEGTMAANDVVGTPTYGIFNGTTTVTSFATAHGTVTINASTGAWTYMPTAEYVGTDSFVLRASGGGLTDSETVSVTVKSDDNVNVSNGVMQFDGVDDQVTFTNGAATLTNHSFTIEFWAMRATSDSQDMVVGSTGGPGANSTLFMGWRGGGESNAEFTVEFYGNGLTYSDPSNTETGVWHHWAVSYDAATNLRTLYRDGIQVAQDTASADFQGAGNLTLGKAIDGRYLDGAVDEFRVWDSARTAEQIYDNHDKTIVGSPSGLAINYHADALSHSGATFSGGTISRAHGDVLSFDGVDDVATVASNAALDTAQGTWSIWVNSAGDWGTDNGAPDNESVFMTRHSSSQSLNGISLGMGTAGAIFLDIKNGSGSVAGVASGPGYADSLWHMVTVTFDQANGSLQKFYIDGVLIGTATASGAWNFAGQDLLFGNSNDTWWEDFKGKLDDARVYGRELTDQEVADLYRGESAGIPGLVSHWDFNEGTGQTIEDGAGALDGALGGGAAAQADDPTRIDADPDVFGTALTISEEQSISGTVGDGIEGLSYTITGAGSANADGRVSAATTHGTITIDTSSGAWTYTPTANYHGSDSFTVTTTDAAGNANTETVAVTVSQVDHVSNIAGDGALKLDGANDYFVAPGVNLGGGSFTIELWVNRASATGADYFASQGNEGSNDQVLHFGYVSSTSIRFGFWGDDLDYVDPSATSGVDEWVHWAASYDAATNLQSLFRNGELVASRTATSDFVNGDADALEIGRFGYHGDGVNNFGGLMDEVRIWNSARTAEDIRANYDQQIAGSESGLQAYYRFDDVANGVVQDGTTGNHDATLVNGASIVDPAVDVPVHGNAVVINEDEIASGQMTASDVVGTATYTVPSQPATDTGTVTINASTGAWVYIPPENWHGSTSFTVRATGGGMTDTETITIKVNEDREPDLHQGALSLDGVNDTFSVDIGTTSASVASGALSFDGHDYVVIGNASGNAAFANIGTTFTAEAWVYIDPAAAGTDRRFLYVGPQTPTPGEGMYLYIGADDKLHFDSAFQTGPSSTSAVTTGAWHHVAAVANGSSVQLYLDGIATGSAQGMSPNVFGGQVVIGSREVNGGNPDGGMYFTGKMAEVRLWDDARTSTEIGDNYNQKLSGTESDLVGYWRLNDPTGQTVTATTGGVNGTLGLDPYAAGNDPTYTAAGPTLIGKVPEINLAAAFTMELWVRTDLNGVQTLMSKSADGTWGTGGKEFGITADGKLFFNIAGGSGFDLISTNSSDISNGAWHHVAFTYSGGSAGTGTFYVDGAAAGSGTISGMPADDLDHDLFIGSQANNAQYFQGEVDEVRIWSEARSATEIDMNHDQQVDPTQPTLEAYYRMDDMSGGMIHDATGNGNDISVVPTVAGPTGNVLTLDGSDDYVTISVGSAAAGGASLAGSLSFDGTNDYVRIPNGVLNGLSSGTIEAWIFLDANGVGTITSKQHDGAATTGVFTIGTPINSNASAVPGQLYFHAYNDANANSTVSVPTGAWHHVAVSFDSAGVQFYIDGRPVETIITQQGPNFGISSVVEPGVTNIGAHGHGSLNNALDGKIAEVRIWQSVRDETEILAKYDEQLVGNENDLKAYYRFDSASSTVTDITGHGYDGTLNGPTLNAGETAFATATPDINLGATTFTLEAWIKTTATGRTIMSKSETGVWEVGGKDFGITSDGKLYFDVYDGGVEFTSTNTASVADGEWHHVAFTYTGTTGKFYIDGTFSGQTTAAIAADDTDHEIFIGARPGANQNFNGQIDEVRIWSDERTASEIRQGMTEQYDFDEAGLKAKYSFEDGATNSANGYGSTTHDGTLTNGATTTDSGSSDPIIMHPPATALTFDGANDTVAFSATVAPTGSAARTFMLWAKTSSSNDQTFLSYGNGTALGSGFGFGLNGYPNSGQGITVDVQGAAVTFQPFTATNDGQWHHYAVVVPAGANLRNLQVYQDGVLLTGIAVLAGNPVLATASDPSFKLGSYVDGLHDFNGQMADVSVWSTALTASQIRDYATHGLAGTESGLAALWRLDEGSGATIYDSATSNANPATSDDGVTNYVGTVQGNPTWVDAAPDVDGNFLQIVENGSANGRMTAEDISGTPSYSLFDGPDHGSMQLNSLTGEWTYVPQGDWQGTDSFTLRATGSTSGVDDEVVSIKVGGEEPGDSALDFTDNPGFVDVGTLSGLAGDMTIEAWIKWNGPAALSANGSNGPDHSWTRIVDFGQGENNDNILLAADGASGKLAFHVRQDAANEGISSSGAMPVDQWIHVAATTNGSTAKLYINGAEVGSGNVHGAADVERMFSFIGQSNWPGERSSDFQISDVRVWNDERDATEIANNYERRLEGNEAGLYAYWKLDEGTGSVAYDSSGNGHDGTITGGSYASQNQIEITGGSAYKGLILGSDTEDGALSYAVATNGGPAHGTFTFDNQTNTYTYDPVDTYSGHDSVTIDVKDDQNQITQHTIDFHLT